MKKPTRIYGHGPVRLMGEAEGYCMVRRPGAMPFVISLKEWLALPAQAGEAGTAATPKSDAVHEHAVGSEASDAPNTGAP